jgi:uncharacterized repeat protein (TIGR01451 family)
VLPVGVGDDGRISPLTQEMRYTVNFQNTGTAPAVNVVVTDEIDSDLDMSTFQMIGATHNVETVIDGHYITWTFSDIMLPDSTTDEPASHGSVMYKIATDANLADETTIENTAYIYFDFNEAIVTNTTLNTIDHALSAEEIIGNDHVSIYPNPATDIINVVVSERSELKITDVNGRLMSNALITGTSQVVDMRGWASGIYLIILRTDDSVSTHRVIKK